MIWIGRRQAVVASPGGLWEGSLPTTDELVKADFIGCSKDSSGYKILAMRCH